jgi:hypothetical protein
MTRGASQKLKRMSGVGVLKVKERLEKKQHCCQETKRVVEKSTMEELKKERMRIVRILISTSGVTLT